MIVVGYWCYECGVKNRKEKKRKEKKNKYTKFITLSSLSLEIINNKLEHIIEKILDIKLI